MDKKKGILNVSISILFKVIILIANILVRRFLIEYVGNDVNGLNSLYASILDFLAVAELGVGTAITFCMYKPIVDGDTDKVSALYGLFTKLYLIIGGIILICGCLLMPVLRFIAKDYQELDVNLYLTFGLTLISVTAGYLFSSKISLINAYKNNYVATTISSVTIIVQCIMQIIVLVVFKSYVLFLACRLFAVLMQWAITEIVVRHSYGNVISNKQHIDSETKIEVTKNIKAMFMHKIGTVLVNTVDSIVISALIGIVILGKYTNYTVIMTAMVGMISLIFTSLTSVIGHMCVAEDKTAVRKYYDFFYNFNFIVGVIFFLGYYAGIDNLVTICFGGGLEMNKAVSMVITVNYFIQFMRQSTLMFRDATGTFYNDRWKPLIEGIVNVVLSVGFVYLFEYLWGDGFAVVGVIVATIITNLFICHIIEPYVLYKYALNASPKKHYIRNYVYISIFVVALVGESFTMITSDNQWIELFANGGISLAFSFVICAAVVMSNKDFKHYAKRFSGKLRHKKTEAEQGGEKKIENTFK